MYCPKGAAPIEGTKFCRGCGLNVEIVPQVISGEVADKADNSPRKRNRGRASVERASSSFFTGVGFILVALAISVFMPGGSTWWFWMLIPGFGCIGKGVGDYLQVRSERELALSQGLASPPLIQQVQPSQLEPPKTPTTSNLGESPSVTEHTTRHLG